MTSPPLARPVQPSLFRPPITRLPTPGATAPGGDAVRHLVVRSRSRGRHKSALPVPLTCAFWLSAAGAGAVGGWATAVLTQRAACSGLVCTIVTLGDRPRLLVVLAAICVVALLGLAPLTRGLTEAGGPELALMVTAAASGVVSVLGVVAVVALTVLLALAGAVALVLLLDRD